MGKHLTWGILEAAVGAVFTGVVNALIFAISAALTVLTLAEEALLDRCEEV